MSSDDIVLGELAKGITRADDAYDGHVWNVLGHRYLSKAQSASMFAWLSLDPAGTGVPPHIHPTQDEFIYVLEGTYTLYLDGEWTTAGPGDLVRMPRGIPHAYYNRSEAGEVRLLGQPGGQAREPLRSPARSRGPRGGRPPLGAHDVDFLPPGSVEGA